MLINREEADNLFMTGYYFTPMIATIINNITDGLIIFDESGKVVFVNKKIEEYLGYLPEDLNGLTYVQAVTLMLGKYYNYHSLKLDWNKLKNGEEIIYKRRFIHKIGQTVPLEVRGYPFYDSENTFRGRFLLLRDLHDALLIKIANLLNSSLTLTTVLKNTTSIIVEHLGLESTAIFLLNNNKDELELISYNVFSTNEDLSKVAFKVGDSALGRIVLEKEPIYVRNLRVDTSIPEYARQLQGDNSSIGYPLIYKEEILGAISFDADRVREFTPSELILFENIAIQVALAIYNTKLFSRLEHLSITDGLTGIFNHRYFQDRLEAEILRTKRNKSTFGLLMLDVDNFKNYNDSYGHLLGDKLLKELAELLLINVRSFDIVARYGGEEFAVILLDCAKEEAVRIAERIRKSIEKNNFHGHDKQLGGKVTVSIGLAMFPEINNKQKLLYFADQALYRSKKYGRNLLQVHSKTK